MTGRFAAASDDIIRLPKASRPHFRAENKIATFQKPGFLSRQAPTHHA
jgi:hypothetical protein